MSALLSLRACSLAYDDSPDFGMDLRPYPRNKVYRCRNSIALAIVATGFMVLTVRGLMYSHLSAH